MENIFKFETEKQLTEFDNKFNYYGVFSTENSVWIYGEGTPKWFSIQYCGDRWIMNYQIDDGKWENVNFYPVTYAEFTNSINNKINK